MAQARVHAARIGRLSLILAGVLPLAALTFGAVVVIGAERFIPNAMIAHVISLFAVVGVAIAFGVSVLLPILIPMLLTREHDPVFEALGMRPSSSALSVRHYRGLYKGRQCFARYIRRRRVIHFSMAERTGTRATFAQRSAWSSGVDSLKLPDAIRPILPDVVVYTKDPSWTLRLLEEPGVAEAIRVILGETSERRAFQVEPNTLMLQRWWVDASTLDATLPREVEALELVTKAAARIGPSPQALEEPAFLRGLREHPERATWITCGCLALALLAAAFFTVIAILLPTLS